MFDPAGALRPGRRCGRRSSSRFADGERERARQRTTQQRRAGSQRGRRKRARLRGRARTAPKRQPAGSRRPRGQAQRREAGAPPRTGSGAGVDTDARITSVQRTRQDSTSSARGGRSISAPSGPPRQSQQRQRRRHHQLRRTPRARTWRRSSQQCAEHQVVAAVERHDVDAGEGGGRGPRARSAAPPTRSMPARGRPAGCRLAPARRDPASGDAPPSAEAEGEPDGRPRGLPRQRTPAAPAASRRCAKAPWRWRTAARRPPATARRCRRPASRCAAGPELGTATSGARSTGTVPTSRRTIRTSPTATWRQTARSSPRATPTWWLRRGTATQMQTAARSVGTAASATAPSSRAIDHASRRGSRERRGGDDRDGHDRDPEAEQIADSVGRGDRGGGEHGERCAVHRGSLTTIRHPRGSRCSARITPPWASTIQRAIASPSPVPPSRVVRAASVR